MARIRTIKPEFFHHKRLARCTPHARLLFAALMQLADREGRLRWIPMQVHGHAFPYESVDISALCRELETIGSVVRYEVGEDEYLVLPSFNIHQRIKGSEAASRLPSPDGAQPAPTRATVAPVVGTGRGIGKGKGKGNREGECKSAGARKWSMFDLRKHLGGRGMQPPNIQIPQWVGILEQSDDEIDEALKLCATKGHPLSYFLALFDGDGKRKERKEKLSEVPDQPRRFVVPDKWGRGLPGGGRWTRLIRGWPEAAQREYVQRCEDGEPKGEVFVDLNERHPEQRTA